VPSPSNTNRVSLKSVTGIGKTADGDDDLLDLPHADGGEDEEVGVADADELLFNDLGEEPEDVGLDTEALGAGDLGASLEDDEEDEAQAGLLDDTPLDVDADLDTGSEEQGWTEDSEGSEGWDDELPQDLSEDGVAEDAGEEGVDDPLLDGLPEQGLPDLATEEEDDEEEDDAWTDDVTLAQLGFDLARASGAGG
jgi:hypothetical protein